MGVLEKYKEQKGLLGKKKYREGIKVNGYEEVKCRDPSLGMGQSPCKSLLSEALWIFRETGYIPETKLLYL